MTTDDLTSRITAALDEDERIARAVIGEHWYFDLIEDGKRAFEDHFTAEAVLGLIAAHREMLEWAETMINRYLDQHRNQAWNEYDTAVSGAARFVLVQLAKAHRIEVPDAH